jgi:hypothetical protein
MEWWQIVLITLGAIAIGLLGGILSSYLFKRFLKGRLVREHDIASVVKEQKPKATSGVEEQKPKVISINQKRKKGVNMVPLLSGRSILILGIGFTVGIMLGVAYWATSPSFDDIVASLQTSKVSQQTDGPHESAVYIQVVSPGADYIPVKELQHMGEYYATEANAYRFLTFLSQKLAEEAPQYSHTADELDQIIRVRYDYRSDFPAIEIMVIGNSNKEALFLTNFIPQVFQDYLVAVEKSRRFQEYQNTLTEIEATTIALLEAEEEMASLVPQEYSHNLDLDPVYIRLDAEIRALEDELDARAQQLAFLITEDEYGSDYREAVTAVDKASTALSQAKIKQYNLEVQAIIDLTPEQKIAYRTATTKLENLSQQLDNLSEVALSLTRDTEVSQVLDYLAVGKPSVPIAVPPDRIRGRNAVMMGGVLGIGITWVLLNRKWLANGMPAPPSPKREEDEE